VLRPLVHIGYHKTGTTWLQDHLFSRRDAAFVVPFDRKTTLNRVMIEPYPLAFDAAAARDALRPEIDRLLAEHRIPVITSESLSGEDASGGYQGKEMADRIKLVFPDANILVVIREQQDIIRSSYQMYVRGNGLVSLRHYLDAPRPARAMPFFHLDYYKYDRLIAYYHRLFGRERVLALPYELLIENGEAFSGAILRHAGAKPVRDLPYGARPKRSWPAFAVALKRYMNPFVDRVVQNGYSPFCPDIRMRYVQNWMFRRVFNPLSPDWLNRMVERRWRHIIAERVGGYYAESNRATSALIGRDLAAFRYEVAGAAAASTRETTYREPFLTASAAE
jgi:hypothetical protein